MYKNKKSAEVIQHDRNQKVSRIYVRWISWIKWPSRLSFWRLQA